MGLRRDDGRRRWTHLSAAALLALGGCRGTPAAPSPPGPPDLPEFITYEGEVVEPVAADSVETARYLNFDTGVTGIPGFKVTIVGGEPDGRSTETHAEGRFKFEDYPYCQLHTAECRSRRFRVEKAGYQTRVVGASDPFHWSSISRSGRRWDDEWKRVVVSREWPPDPQVQRMLRELPAMDPLYLVERRDWGGGGGYVGRKIWVWSLESSHLLAHEYCHAHQDWAADPDDSNLSAWNDSPEGLAFREAWEADAHIKDPLIAYRPGGGTEAAADICSTYFIEREHSRYGLMGPGYLRDRLPHLYAWAVEWLRRR